MQSKTNKLREQLASAALERELIEKQKKDLEAQMSKGKNNMDKISKGLKGHEISGVLSELDLDKDTNELTKQNKVKHTNAGKMARNASTKTDAIHASPVKTSSIYNIKSMPSTSSMDPNVTLSRLSAMKQTVIMPACTRITDWCYTGALQSSPPTVKSNDVYEFVRWLGRGSFGDVQLVKSVEEKQLFAMKTIFSEHETETQKSLREVMFLRSYRHPYIIEIFDSFLTQQPKMLYIVMHYCEGGDLGKVITNAQKNSTSISEHQIIKWSIQLALALHFLHENQIVHRDLKPSNALVTDGGETVKLADFGLTIQLENNVCERATEAGTPLYAAPEMINGEKYSYPIDCWSFGVMLHELMRLNPPFQKADTTELVKSILNDDPPELPSNYSYELK
jgi:NIMA (never in mitosis gene a)-related kinase 2